MPITGQNVKLGLKRALKALPVAGLAGAGVGLASGLTKDINNPENKSTLEKAGDITKNVLTGARNFVAGEPGKELPLQKYTPQQQDLQNQIIQMISQQLGQKQNPSFEPIAQYARTQFGEQTVPSIAERFTAAGAGGGRSSAFGQQLGQAASNLELGLGAQRSGFESNQQDRELKYLLSLLGYGLTPSFEPNYIPATTGALQSSLPAIVKLLTTLAL